MPRRVQQRDPELLRKKLVQLLESFGEQLRSGTLREKVIALIPALNRMKDLGASLIPKEIASNAQDRIREYFLEYPFTIIAGQELEVVSGISEYARRVRELRVEMGWSIASGQTAKEMNKAEELDIEGVDLESMKRDEYILTSTEQDKEAAYRWKVANRIRRGSGSVREKILAYLREHVGSPVTGEELRYVAKGRTEWARRCRELRTEYGWPVLTANNGRPDLPPGVYVLEEDRQAPEHDRTIKDSTRGEVLRRDGNKCTKCGWTHENYNRSDPRHLELHHVKHHAMKGENTKDNLITLCTVCHDVVHSNRGSK